MDIPSKCFSNGNLAQGSIEASKEHRLPDTSFLVWGGLFPPSTGIEKVLVPLVLSSLKSLEDHLL
jgi:hypothetical protein